MATATVSGLTTVIDMEGSPSITAIGSGPGGAVDQDVFIQGSQSVGRRASSSTLAGVGVNFTSTDLSSARVWVWWNNPLGASSLNTLANGGVRLRFSSSSGGSSNYEEFYVGGSDVTVSGRWNRTVLDVANLTPANSSGTCNYSAIVNITIMYWFSGGAPGGTGSHMVIDAIHYGDVIEVTGGSAVDPLTWSDISAATETSTNAWGVLRSAEGSSLWKANGTIQLGDLSGSSNCYLTDSNQLIEFSDQVYYTGSTVAASVPTTFQGIDIVEDSGTTQIVDGTKIGTGDTATGANGSLIQLPVNPYCEMHFDASDADITDLSLYGTKIARASNDVSFCDDGTNGPNHEVLGVTFDDCAQVNAGRVVMRDCVFQGYDGTDAALLWNANIDIKNSAFRSNTDGSNDPAGIEHTVAGSVDYYGLTFASNDYDVYFSAASGDLTVNLYDGSNASTARVTGTGSATFVNAVTVLVTAKDAATLDDVQGARVLLTADTGGALPFEDSVTLARSGTTVTVTHTGHGLENGAKVQMTDASAQEYRGVFAITYISANSYSYTCVGTPATPGTAKATAVILDGTTDVNGEIETTFNYGSAQPVTGRVRRGTATPRYKSSPLVGSIGANGFEQTSFLVSDE